MLLPHGASMGSGYGPIVVAREPLTLDELREVEIAVPGPHDDRVPRPAAGARRDVRATASVPFDRILDEVESGRAEAGLADPRGPAHVRGRRAARRSLDLGEWWLLETGLPLPLGVNVARRDLGADVLAASSPTCCASRSAPGSTTATRRSRTRCSSAAASTPSSPTASSACT